MSAGRRRLDQALEALIMEGADFVTREFLARDADAPRRSDLTSAYQSWYSRALPFVHQVLPERYAEFVELYRPGGRARIDRESYAIADYLAGVQVTGGTKDDPAFDPKLAFGQKLGTQVAILGSGRDRLDSILTDIETELHAPLLDAQLRAAGGLLESGYPRAAAAAAGVALVVHLRWVADRRSVRVLGEAPSIADVNDHLKDADVYGVEEWRRIERLADVHRDTTAAGTASPPPAQVVELLDGARRAIKTVF